VVRDPIFARLLLRVSLFSYLTPHPSLCHTWTAVAAVCPLPFLTKWAENHNSSDVFQVLHACRNTLSDLDASELVTIVRSSPFSQPFLEHGRDILVDAVRARTGDKFDAGSDVPHEFCCPITLMPFKDPICFADGFTYERAALEKHLSRYATSPKTGETYFTKDVVPNHNLRILIYEHNERNARATQDRRDAFLEHLLSPRPLVTMQLSVGLPDFGMSGKPAVVHVRLSA